MKTKQQLRFLATILFTTILFVLAKTDTDPLEGNFQTLVSFFSVLAKILVLRSSLFKKKVNGIDFRCPSE